MTAVTFPTSFPEDDATDLSPDSTVVVFPTAAIAGDDAIAVSIGSCLNLIASVVTLPTAGITEDDAINFLSPDSTVVVFPTAGIAGDDAIAVSIDSCLILVASVVTFPIVVVVVVAVAVAIDEDDSITLLTGFSAMISFVLSTFDAGGDDPCFVESATAPDSFLIVSVVVFPADGVARANSILVESVAFLAIITDSLTTNLTGSFEEIGALEDGVLVVGIFTALLDSDFNVSHGFVDVPTSLPVGID